MSKVYGIDSPAKVDGVATPAKVDGVVFSYGVDYWPVTGVTKPQHYWPFSQTGDYTDQGSTGGLTLSPQGSGNSFGANGLILNGSGYANSASSNDLQDLGATFSLLFEIIPTAAYIFCGASNNSTTGYYPFYVGGNARLNFRTFDGSQHQADSNNTTLVQSGVQSQFVITQDSGTTKFYKDGSPATINANAPTPNATTSVFGVGALGQGTLKMTGTIVRVGVLKGTAWGDTDVSDIYASLP